MGLPVSRLADTRADGGNRVDGADRWIGWLLLTFHRRFLTGPSALFAAANDVIIRICAQFFFSRLSFYRKLKNALQRWSRASSSSLAANLFQFVRPAFCNSMLGFSVRQTTGFSSSSQSLRRLKRRKQTFEVSGFSRRHSAPGHQLVLPAGFHPPDDIRPLVNTIALFQIDIIT